MFTKTYALLTTWNQTEKQIADLIFITTDPLLHTLTYWECWLWWNSTANSQLGGICIANTCVEWGGTNTGATGCQYIRCPIFTWLTVGPACKCRIPKSRAATDYGATLIPRRTHYVLLYHSVAYTTYKNYGIRQWPYNICLEENIF
jgi:hypothetical protein